VVGKHLAGPANMRTAVRNTSVTASAVALASRRLASTNRE